LARQEFDVKAVRDLDLSMTTSFLSRK